MVETPYVKLELLPSGILVATYKRRALITLELAKEIVKTRLDFTGRTPRPVIVFNLGVLEFHRDAQYYVSHDEGVAGLSAGAIIKDHLSSALISSFILKVAKTQIPARAFYYPQKAMKWLETFLPVENGSERILTAPEGGQ